MSFREKSAWVTLVSVLLCCGVYFGAVFSGSIPRHSMVMLHLALGCIAAMIVLQASLTIIATLTTAKDGKGPRDEREKMIQARSHTIGYYTLMVAVALLLIPTHTRGVTMVDIVNFAFLGIIVSAIVVVVAQIVMFRRGY